MLIYCTNVLSAPPGRTGAFDEFKQTRGANLNKTYVENKELLAAKKKQFAELARRVNQTKAEIDKTRIDAERKKNERINMGKREDLHHHDFLQRMIIGEFLNENGETIIDEEEYGLIAKLQELKGIYRTDYDQWKNLKSEITYCQNLIKQSQNRLLQGLFLFFKSQKSFFLYLEFDVWYNEYYLNGKPNPGGIDDVSSSTKTNNNEYRLYDDAAERFEQMQKELLLSDLDSMPFRQAQTRTNRRVSDLNSSFSIFILSFQHVFDTATNQGSWKQAPSSGTTATNSGSYQGRNYDQDPQAFSTIHSRQKPMVR